ncbi:PREDICTED: uncharacterized protein LOC104817899 isoform X2 [Tarenaya hassleriana]|uniref:uncharacterized protein LOC104817899 isoform X2 n=1 Tax=Tarenaya hassleriana TaxID=28532 RepID=UPI00053C1E2A|nr:PREDICTED: uncharacterized protein LOC104817899 isoform X2 [Tarenaya hassleriana]
MLEPVLSSTRVFSAFREECGDEELSVLPRHTKVIVTGNNRTKSVLVGLQGVVKKAVGLGGWHWLVLKNGIEVKLQRNALSVLEHPTGDELEDDEEEIDMFSSGSDIIADKEHDFDTGLGFHRMSRPARIRQTKPWISSSLARANRSSSSSYRDVQSILRSRVNFGKLGSSALRRYCRHFHLRGINQDSSRDQMLHAMQLHFTSLPRVNEEQVISDFVVAAKRSRRMED